MAYSSNVIIGHYVDKVTTGMITQYPLYAMTVVYSETRAIPRVWSAGATGRYFTFREDGL